MAVDRKRGIVRILSDRTSWVTASALAQEMGCSSRTIKTDIMRLNSMHEGLIESGPKGYRLADSAASSRILSNVSPEVPQTAEARKRYILFELLMRHRELSCADLAESLYISLATLDNELVAIKRELTDYGLSLRSRGGSIHVEGSARGERKMVAQLIFDETKDYFSQFEMINGYFPGIDLRALRGQIDASLKSRGFYINDYALSNLIIHIAIFVERTLNGFDPAPLAVKRSPHSESSSDVALSRELEQSVEEICAAIESDYDAVVAESDREAVYVMLSVNLIHTGGNVLDDPEHKKAFEVLEVIARRVRDVFSLDFSDHDFMLRFSLHLANLFSRAALNMQLRNPQLGDIKNGQPFIYDVAVFVADVIRSETGFEINEDEIAYIALHVGCLIEEQRTSANKLHALLVCAQHNVNGAERIEAFSREVERSLVIDAVASSIEDVDSLDRYDLVVSTFPISGYTSVPVVQISSFLGSRDARAIEERADAIRRTREREELNRDMRTFFRQEFFSIEPDVANWREAIDLMGGRLVDEGYAFDDFCERLLEREEMSSSAYCDIALPHPVDMDARRTAVSVALFPRGLSWQGRTVHAVLMLAIKRDDRAFFSELFNHIAVVLTIPGAMRSISRATTYQQFLDAMLSYL